MGYGVWGMGHGVWENGYGEMGMVYAVCDMWYAVWGRVRVAKQATLIMAFAILMTSGTKPQPAQTCTSAYPY